MQPADLPMVLIRWAHSLAAIAWVGGALFHWVVLGPAARESLSPEHLALLHEKLGAAFRELAQVGTAIFVITGALMAFERLSSGSVPPAYALLLAAKVLLAMFMFHLALQMQRRPGTGVGPWRAMFAVGSTVVLLAIILRTIYEARLRP